MAEWMTIRVVLRGRDGDPLPQPPGRVLLAHTDHTFADLASAIDRSFARWDLSPLHLFEVGARQITSDVELADAGPGSEASTGVALATLADGEPVLYTFDLGEGWEHDVEVEQTRVDPLDLYGEEPAAPVAVFGWGTIPDQYGRETEQEDEDEGLAVVVDLEAGAEDEDWDEEAELAAWDQARESAWVVVRDAVAEVDRRVPTEELALVAAGLRRSRGDGDDARRLLWEAADLDALPDDDAALWTALAAAVVEPQGEPALPADVEAAWAALEPADWAGAVIELARSGIGQPAGPQELVRLIERCPEIEGPELSAEDVELLETAFGTVVHLWRALGAVDEDYRLTALGRWGLPESLRQAWLGDRVSG